MSRRFIASLQYPINQGQNVSQYFFSLAILRAIHEFYSIKPSDMEEHIGRHAVNEKLPPY